MYGDVTPRQTHPRADWTLAGERSHVVQFYDEDDRLIDLLARYTGTALVSGESAIVVATAGHRRRLAARLEARGLEIAVPRRQGRYLPVDAATVVARSTARRGFDVNRFEKAMGALVERAARASAHGRVAVFGEVVALLWAANRRDVALRIEAAWNDLARQHDFSLCCAYPMTHFGSGEHAAPFLQICAQHSHVFPATTSSSSPRSAPSASSSSRRRPS